MNKVVCVQEPIFPTAGREREAAARTLLFVVAKRRSEGEDEQDLSPLRVAAVAAALWRWGGGGGGAEERDGTRSNKIGPTQNGKEAVRPV